MASTAKTTFPVQPVPTAKLTLDDLSAMNSTELGERYANGSVPQDFNDLGTTPRGRVLAINHLDNRITAPIIATVAKVPFFPWEGKSMAATGTDTGDGINRINLGLRMNWFPFKTLVEKSVIDGADTVYLDYEQKGNPYFIRKIRDELREIEPGLFLGPAMWKTGETSAMLVLWFALDAR